MKKILVILQVVLFFSGCAKIGSPTGGPKDIDPPEIILSTPENYSTNFTAKKVELEFNEYVEIKDIRKNLIVSPPLKENPYVRVKGKGIVFDVKDTLKSNTTYTLNFGEAIVDFREGNALKNYEYVFSTGDYLDSLTVSGQILDAFTLKSDKDPYFVMLYENLTDSAPMKELPLYVGRTDPEGKFRINNIRTDTFRLIALQDANTNLLFDALTEKMAFLDTSFFLSAEKYIQYDTIVFTNPDSVDLNSEVPDSIPLDSISVVPVYSFHCNLFSFNHDVKEDKQYIKDYNRNKRYNLNLMFNTTIKDSSYLTPLNFEPSESWYILEPSTGYDTLSYWITDSSVYKLDTLVFAVNYQMKDSLGQYVWTADTTSFRFVKKQLKKGDKKKDTDDNGDKKEKYISLKINKKNKSILDLNKQLSFSIENPLATIDTSKIEFSVYEDTIPKRQNYMIVPDSVKMRKYHFINSWIEDSHYKLVLYPGAFTDIYGNTNDTIDYGYTTQKMDYYGVILLNLTNVDGNVVVQLMDKKENVILERYASEDGEIILDYINPDEYMLKVIYDRNNNGKWDPGNYLEKKQPEKVEYYKGELKLRTNWDMQVNFELKGGDTL